MHKFKLIQLNGDGNYVVIYNTGGRLFSNWRYIQTYSCFAPDSFTIQIMSATAGSSRMITAFQELISYLKKEAKYEEDANSDAIHDRTILGKWETIEELEEFMNNLPVGS